MCSATALANSSPKKISFATSHSIEPYFFIHKNGGVQYELLNAALKMHDLEIANITFASNLRASRLVSTKAVDCIINAPANLDKLYLTQSLIEYQNNVFYLSKNNLNINKLEDLLRISLIGFQNANQYLGEEFKQMTFKHQDYNEMSNQKSQVLMLFEGHTQAIVLERRIFNYYRNQVKHKVNTDQEITEVVLFAPAQRHIACHSPDTAKAIDKAISSLKHSTVYQKILLDAEKAHYQ
ncbi:substrate-binding periplasmic protein [Shewanella aestuarii]|uniref:Amino acid ABC transporter substrate-binding protein n=1 Tax=Shewanella aestuarii TaxID=1028752 RepID=A0A6G9QNY6_9GAMM|nr:transporter substrate-binding domain-containing protein [Shewanella aestuarii]QIR15549.1 amino acid ABC transporter substrate-binding protein [Shewanella aestuarii]